MRLTATLILALFASCTAREKAAEPKETKATVIFTADLWGQLEPCGCSADMRGGVDRIAAWVKKRRAERATLFFDAGDALYDATSFDERAAVQARIKAETMASALLVMGVDGKALYERDEVFDDAHFPARLVLRGGRVFDADGVKIGVVELDLIGKENVRQELAERVRTVKDQGARVVLAILHGPRSEVIAHAADAAAAKVDAVVGSHVESIPEGDQSRAVFADLPVFFTQARGQSVLELDVVLRDAGKLQIAGSAQERESEIASIDQRIQTYERRIVALGDPERATPFREKIAELQQRRRELVDEPPKPPSEGNYLAWRFVPITEDRGADPQVAKLLSAYDRAVGEANLAHARANPTPCPEAPEGEASYVGNAACATCHAPAMAHWQTTKHAQAWETLVEANKQADLSCISCHVTGWEKPGGVCDVAHTEGREDVGCESCHGPGSLHVKNPVQTKLPRKVPEAQCVSCHNPENSAAFDYEVYLKRIVGPGHGEPLPKPAP